MKKLAAPFFLIVFLTFVAVPTVVVLIDDSVDISFAFTVNEEENSKELVELKLLLDRHTNYDSIHFLQDKDYVGYYFHADHPSVYLDILSPPPKRLL